ncbi:uncharacterized protein Z519_04837 [Cladophialophora bantiana CBS 173.52]|uniref:Uncharacterized protein n=1 Tax=Cladophialophora bantiana (strain ATCC 10958 / CBS 173.52 / CDC B-1940 / NIH 8579) TaxID=1442370 RepID=A0A0D2IDL9_CLAB1|nr:uncharacterized protein Z519_04837 [Cladophialophora bantiana CBS 173.52]KIW94859.1 hypothetical protein Z519_04837 [Cladophialophora bantiana CBS 173.52]
MSHEFKGFARVLKSRDQSEEIPRLALALFTICSLGASVTLKTRLKKNQQPLTDTDNFWPVFTGRSWNAVAMVNWRERGYVPDSDDDDEAEEEGGGSLNIDHTRGTTSKTGAVNVQASVKQAIVKESDTVPGDDDDPTKQSSNKSDNHGAHHHPGPTRTNGVQHDSQSGHLISSQASDSHLNSTAAKLEAEIKRCLRTVHDVLGSVDSGINSDTDSPLSSVPSSVRTSPFKSQSGQSRPAALTEVAIDQTSADNRLSPGPSADASRRRCFRPRAPIQLHPYAIEDARYRQTWKDRGLHPVRAPDPPSHLRESAKDESQGSTAYESSQADHSDSQVRRLSPAPEPGYDDSQVTGNDESQSPIRGTRLRIYPLVSDSDNDDDLPDLSDILKGRTATSSISKLKRPKRAPVSQSPRLIDEFPIHDLLDDGIAVRNASKHGSASSIIPLSPPRSGGGQYSQVGEVNNNAEASIGNSTPVLLPTPLVSSDKRASKRRFSETLSFSDSETDVISISDDLSAPSELEESMEDGFRGIRQMRRKMKGVLPASWLTLDMKQQRKDNRGPRNRPQSPVKRTLEKGIAQHVSSSGGRAKGHILSADVADLEASSESQPTSPASDEMRGVEYEGPGPFEDDVIEDNTIDAMLAPRQRRSYAGQKQQRLKVVWSRKNTSEGSESVTGPRSSSRRQRMAAASGSNNEARPRKKIKRKQRKPQMTILDAPGFGEKEVPLFLRIASRRTTQSSARKQDPSKKFFRLATMRDTEDVNEGMRSWRGHRNQADHSVKPSDIAKAATPLLAQPHSVDDITFENTAAPTRTPNNDIYFSDPRLKSLKQTTRAILERIHNHQSRSRSLRDESIAPSIDRRSAILDYFKPRATRRSHLNAREPIPTLQQNREKPEEPALAPTNPFTIEKRVPQAARQRQKRPRQNLPQKACTESSIQATLPMAQPVENQDLSPPSPPLPQSRPPKKQRPIALSTRFANGFDQHDVLCLQTLKLDDDNDIISYAIQYPPGTSSWRDTPFPHDSTSVRVRLLDATLSSMADTTRLFQPQWSQSSITTPKSQRTLRATGWSTEVESIIRDAFQEIFEIICGAIATSDATPDEQARLLSQAAESVETIITYANESLSFSNNQELEAFIHLTSKSIENLWQAIAICNTATSKPHVSQALKVLNGFLILGYQIYQCTKITGFPETIRGKTSKTWKNIASLAWELAFRKQNVAQLFCYIAAQLESDSVLDGHQFTPTTEIETVFLIHRLGPHQEWNIYLENILSTHGKAGMVWESQAESLAFTVVVLGCILSIVGLHGLTTHSDASSASSLGCSLLRLLPTYVSEFLKFFVEKRASYSMRFKAKIHQVRKLERFGLVIFRWCFVFARNFQIDTADSLLKQMFKYYSDKTNNMLELFASNLSDGVPPFVDHLTRPEQLVLEATDTDFHIFLKLTAITLAAQPLADYETEEHVRKLALRKRSLLFILLPNKGRDNLDDNAMLVDEDYPLPDLDLAAISNRYTLFTTLYHYAPIGFKPELSQIRDYIDFPTAHDAVRKVIVRCWENVANSALSRATGQAAGRVELLELGQWLLSMFFSMRDKLSRIPNIDNSMHEDEKRIHRANRNTTVDCILNIAKRYATAIDLCANQDQVSCLLTREEVNSLTVSCYSKQGLGDIVVSGIFDLFTSYLKKVGNVNDEIRSLMRDIRGVLVDQLNRGDPPDDVLLMSLTDTWFAIGKLMIDGGYYHGDQFLTARSQLSFPQIADTEIARQCQVLLLSKIATDRNVILANPCPFVSTWLRSMLKPETMIKFEHRLTNQLMESIPDAFSLDELRRTISNGASSFFFDRSDIIKYRFSIVDHVIRYACSVQNDADPPSSAKLTKHQWDELMTKIERAMKQTWEQLDGAARPEWTIFMQKVIFRLSMYKSPGFAIDPWFLNLDQKGFEDKVFFLERLFIRLLDGNRRDRCDTEYMATVLRTACEMAWDSDKEEQFFQHLVGLFAANDPSYVDNDGKFLLDIASQLDFMKAVFPAYIERALNDTLPAMLFAVPILRAAAAILMRLELRVDLEDQSHMESFAELIVALMEATVTAMRDASCGPLFKHGWEIETICHLGHLCWLGCSRWAHLHRLFPCSGAIFSLQAYVQAYAYYAYEWICTAADLEDGARPSDPELWAKYRMSADRAREDFGFELPELALPEHISALKDFAADDLEWSGRNDWHRREFTTWGPVWVFARPGLKPAMKQSRHAVQDNSMINGVRAVLASLEQALTLLGVLEEEL